MFINIIYIYIHIQNQKYQKYQKYQKTKQTKKPKKNKQTKKNKKTNKPKKTKKKTMFSKLVWKLLFFVVCLVFLFFLVCLFFLVFLVLIYILFINICGVSKHIYRHFIWHKSHLNISCLLCYFRQLLLLTYLGPDFLEIDLLVFLWFLKVSRDFLVYVFRDFFGF